MVKQKASFTIFKGFSVANNCFRLERARLSTRNLARKREFYIKKYIQRKMKTFKCPFMT